ncbi:hypothetical protein DWQ65_10035 [Treponema phagedenis]|uniref:Uncharacterized protein n=1 Tax=Treponema phagedenis TaxID=162 RepID=A0AAE6IWE6_TREPH|nr:hypothetical protein FUT79_00370 [Treponema phagedenis]QEJ99529.1 hypothetical protein FUT82_00170 [Treponema phagedenis]QEK02168.1 hypothetical protein FUT84_00160 [Treponema phagedenis]QEK05100.1 hypothetical protein FUT83_00165 [Treponema phagedenis]QEK07926.1 hypothetical protein FUT80_11770 [Treponema phagedenis]
MQHSYGKPPGRQNQNKFKRCFKVSTQNCKIEALKLVGEPKVEIPKVRPVVSLLTVAPCRALFYDS